VKNRHVVIEIRFDRIDIAACRGNRVVAAQRLAVSLTEDAAVWARDLDACAPLLTAAVKSLDAEGATADVYVASPTLVAEIASIAAHSEGMAREAARLACHESAAYPHENATGDAVFIARDKGIGDRKRHFIAAVERDDHARAVADLVHAAGLRLRMIGPIDGPSAAEVMQDSVAAGEGVRAIAHIGEVSSILVVSRGGMIVFCRRLRVGVDTFIRALTLGIRTPDSADVVTLTAEEAADIVTRHGFPARDEVILAEHGLRGQHVLPALQPVLQRLVVELRQSLRFGLSAEDRAGVTITLRGAGARLPGLAQVLSAELGLGVAIDANDAAPFDRRTVGAESSDLAIALRSGGPDRSPCLLPRDLLVRRSLGRVRKLTWSGAAAALALLAFDAVRLDARVESSRQAADSMTLAAESLQNLVDARDRIFAFKIAMSEVEATLATELNGNAPFAPFIRELAIINSADIRLSGLTLTRSANGCEGRLSGFAFQHDGEDGLETSLGSYLRSLESSPLVAAVSLRSAQASAFEDHPAERFEIDLTLVSWSSIEAASTLAEVSP
jgi:Tfp pilus assembly PilM family ATPase